MSLEIVGDATYQAQVRGQLQQICACREIEVVGSLVAFGDDIEACCCGSPLGCTLVANLVDDVDCNVTITAVCLSQDPNDPCCYSSYSAQANTIFYFICDENFARDCFGSGEPRKALVAAALAHELIHAFLDCNPEYGDWWDEVRVCCGENQIREEMDAGPRCTHGGTEIPQFGCAWLPNEWHIDSGCYRTLRFWWCVVIDFFKAVPVKAERVIVWLARKLFGWTGAFRTEPSDDTGLWDWSEQPTVQRRLAQAAWVRERDSTAQLVDRLIRSIELEPGPRTMLMLEEVTIERPYVVTLIYETDGAVEVVSNRGQGVSTLVRYRFPGPLPGAFHAIARSEVLARSPSGIGDADVADGTVHTLTVRSDGLVGGVAELHGLQFRNTNPDAPAPTDGQGRALWEAVNDFYALRTEIMSRDAEAVSPV